MSLHDSKRATAKTDSAGTDPRPQEPEQRLGYSVGEFARSCGKHKVWGYRQIYKGRIRVVRDAGRLLIPADEVRRFFSDTIAYAGKLPKANTP